MLTFLGMAWIGFEVGLAKPKPKLPKNMTDLNLARPDEAFILKNLNPVSTCMLEPEPEPEPALTLPGPLQLLVL